MQLDIKAISSALGELEKDLKENANDCFAFMITEINDSLSKILKSAIYNAETLEQKNNKKIQQFIISLSTNISKPNSRKIKPEYQTELNDFCPLPPTFAIKVDNRWKIDYFVHDGT